MDVRDQLSNWVDEYVGRLTRLAFTYVRDWAKAEDVVQEAFLKAYRSMHQLKTPENPLPWLQRIVINECRTTHRKTWREVAMSLPEVRSQSAEEKFFHDRANQELHLALLSIAEKYRTPMYLHYLEGMSTQDIAIVLKITAGSVRVRLHRGREQLQKQLHKNLERGDQDDDRGFLSEISTRV